MKLRERLKKLQNDTFDQLIHSVPFFCFEDVFAVTCRSVAERVAKENEN